MPRRGVTGATGVDREVRDAECPEFLSVWGKIAPSFMAWVSSPR
jgi:hypothetical protein